MYGYYNVNNRKMYVYTGNNGGIPVLYIHGAPGIGVLDIEQYQSRYFEKDYYLVAPEQRGVWRSQELFQNEEYDLDMIIEDYEELRKQLGIKEWIVLCHCMGARTAIKYYNKYPKVISMMLFENPVLDSLSPFESIIKIQLSLIKQSNEEEYEHCSAQVANIHNPLQLEEFCRKLEKNTNIEANNLIMSTVTVKKLSGIKDKFDIDLFMRSRKTEIKMSHSQSLYERIYYMVDNISVPLLIIYGKNDIVVPQNVINEIRKRVLKCDVQVFENCKHWVHLDDEQGYFRAVNNFITENLV